MQFILKQDGADEYLHFDGKLYFLNGNRLHAYRWSDKAIAQRFADSWNESYPNLKLKAITF